MRRLILVSLFLVLMVAETFSLDMSLAPGLSVKNAYLYVILLILVLEWLVRGREQAIAVGTIHAAFLTLIGYATLTWYVISFIVQYSGYDVVLGFISLKTQLVDHYIFFLVFFYGVTKAQDALWVSRWVLAIVAVSSLVTVMDGLNTPDLGLIHQRADGRVSGPLGESNQYGAFLVFFIPALVARAVDLTGLRRWLMIGGVLLSFGALVLTTSRGAVVGLIVGSAAWVFLMRDQLSAKHVTRGLVGLAVSGTIALAIAVQGDYGELLERRFVEHSTEGTATEISSGRLAIWERGLALQAEQPVSFLVGYGWNTYQLWSYGASHNAYLDHLFCLGAIGLVIFLILVAAVINAGRLGVRAGMYDGRGETMGFLCGWLSFLTALMFVNIFNPWLFVWAFSGLMVRVALEAQRAADEVGAPRAVAWGTNPY